MFRARRSKRSSLQRPTCAAGVARGRRPTARFDDNASVAVESPAGTLTAGPGAMGGFVRFEADPLTTPVGPSFAPLAARAFERADTEFGVRLGPLEPARQVR